LPQIYQPPANIKKKSELQIRLQEAKVNRIFIRLEVFLAPIKVEVCKTPLCYNGGNQCPWKAYAIKNDDDQPQTKEPSKRTT
jgi:hypothetical protein